LAAHPDERLRRLAYAILRVSVTFPPQGWTPERLERLQKYRQDSSPLVAGVAQFTFPDEVTSQDEMVAG
jgi:hypothetical protein